MTPPPGKELTHEERVDRLVRRASSELLKLLEQVGVACLDGMEGKLPSRDSILGTLEEQTVASISPMDDGSLEAVLDRNAKLSAELGLVDLPLPFGTSSVRFDFPLLPSASVGDTTPAQEVKDRILIASFEASDLVVELGDSISEEMERRIPSLNPGPGASSFIRDCGTLAEDMAYVVLRRYLRCDGVDGPLEALYQRMMELARAVPEEDRLAKIQEAERRKAKDLLGNAMLYAVDHLTEEEISHIVNLERVRSVMDS